MLEFLGFNGKAELGSSDATPIFWLYLLIPIVAYLAIMLPLSKVKNRVVSL